MVPQGNWDDRLANSNYWNIDLSANYNYSMHLLNQTLLKAGQKHSEI